MEEIKTKQLKRAKELEEQKATEKAQEFEELKAANKELLSKCYDIEQYLSEVTKEKHKVKGKIAIIVDSVSVK